MNDEKRPDANETSTKAVMPGEVAALTDLPQKGSA